MAREIIELNSDVGTIKKGSRGMIIKDVDENHVQASFINLDGTQTCTTIPRDKITIRQ